MVCSGEGKPCLVKAEGTAAEHTKCVQGACACTTTSVGEWCLNKEKTACDGNSRHIYPTPAPPIPYGKDVGIAFGALTSVGLLACVFVAFRRKQFHSGKYSKKQIVGEFGIDASYYALDEDPQTKEAHTSQHRKEPSRNFEYGLGLRGGQSSMI